MVAHLLEETADEMIQERSRLLLMLWWQGLGSVYAGRVEAVSSVRTTTSTFTIHGNRTGNKENRKTLFTLYLHRIIS
jgi:hypothetical protein